MRGLRAADEAAAEHARAAFGRVVEHAGLAGRDALLAVDQLHLVPSRPALSQAGRGARVERTLTNTSRRSTSSIAPSPIQFTSLQRDRARRERRARADHDAPRLGLEPQHVERFARRDAQSFALPDGVMDDAVVPPEHAARPVDDVAGRGGAGAQALDDVGIASGRHEADVLAVLLVGDRKSELARELAHARLRQLAEREAQEFELRARGREQEIALVAIAVMRAIERAAAVGEAAVHHIVPGRQHLRAEVARGGEQVGELDRPVALDARHRRLARRVARRRSGRSPPARKRSS